MGKPARAGVKGAAVVPAAGRGKAAAGSQTVNAEKQNASRKAAEAPTTPPDAARKSTRSHGATELVALDLYAKKQKSAPSGPAKATPIDRSGKQSPPSASRSLSQRTPVVSATDPSGKKEKKRASESRRTSDVSESPPTAKRQKLASGKAAAAPSPASADAGKKSVQQPSAKKQLLLSGGKSIPRPLLDQLSTKEIDAVRASTPLLSVPSFFCKGPAAHLATDWNAAASSGLDAHGPGLYPHFAHRSYRGPLPTVSSRTVP